MPCKLKINIDCIPSIKIISKRQIILEAFKTIENDLLRVDDPKDLRNYGKNLSDKDALIYFNITFFYKFDSEKKECEILNFSI